MRRPIHNMRAKGTGLIALMLLAACGLGTPAQNDSKPHYLGVQTRLLENDLVSFQVRMRNAANNGDVAAYGECAAAQYALIRGFGFARHVRTSAEKRGSVWHGDAVYVISAALPDGVTKIDAEVVVQHCAEQGIPTV
jgi:hypothetical protein